MMEEAVYGTVKVQKRQGSVGRPNSQAAFRVHQVWSPRSGSNGIFRVGLECLCPALEYRFGLPLRCALMSQNYD